MNTLLYVITCFAAVLGLGVSIWSFFDTRKKYGKGCNKEEET
ncbi:hypothetical protein FHS03_002558 [Massilia violacea]|uniref:Uncharacterized protein n=1 Tax=Pseudoduganella violacea TaxID=1715466 RepID=A0A7W5BAE2_9BURK|nr:hypothetical protein [Pseudoduganella violacea]